VSTLGTLGEELWTAEGIVRGAVGFTHILQKGETVQLRSGGSQGKVYRSGVEVERE